MADGEILVMERKQKTMKENLEWKNQKGIRKYLANKKDEEGNKEFVIRIRKKGDILYYKGFKILEMTPSTLKLSDDIVQFNKASIMNEIKNYHSNLNSNREEYVKCNVLSKINNRRKEMIDEGILHVDKNDCSIKIERKYKKKSSDLEHDGLNKILEYVGACQTLNVDIEYVKEYKLKAREKLDDSKNKELDGMLRNLANERKDILEHDLRDKIINAELNIDKRYQQKQLVLCEEKLKECPQEEQKKIEKNWNKKYVLSYNLASSEGLEIKKFVQNTLCDDKNFDDNNKKEIKENEKYCEINDYIIYHLNFNSGNKKPITEAESKELADIEYEIIRNRIFDENLVYHQISKPTFSTIIGKSQSIEELESLDDIDNLTSKMKSKVELYIGDVKEEVEKHYQFQFMIQDETKRKIKKANKEAKNQIIYPFEQEYFILNRKGRIDAIFFGIKEHTADLYLIELKVNESVIGGTNGVHKHLSDIYELLSQEKIKTDFLHSLKKSLNYRLKALDEKTESEEIKKIDMVHFWTIVGYTDENHKETSKNLLDFYYSHDPSNQKETKNQLKKLKDKYTSLKNIDISIPKSSKSLKEYIEKLNNNGIDVKFFLDPTNSTCDPAYSISEDDFEKVDFKSN